MLQVRRAIREKSTPPRKQLRRAPYSMFFTTGEGLTSGGSAPTDQGLAASVGSTKNSGTGTATASRFQASWIKRRRRAPTGTRMSS